LDWDAQLNTRKDVGVVSRKGWGGGMGTGRPSLFEGELLECIYCYCSAVLHERQAPETNLSSQSKKTSPTLRHLTS